MERTDQYDTVHREARDLFQKKNQDYGDAFAEHGTVGVLVRIGDKLKRLVRVTRNGVNLVNDESLRDGCDADGRVKLWDGRGTFRAWDRHSKHRKWLRVIFYVYIR
jgi:hypothetical protein